ncbi:Anterior pharynx defective 1 [Fasciola gigantica]|uniref:Anterior pharynx defective 1 n=1 Tax=Fasciola gigantica TaxID=46835 RepID=A0A504YQJ0_FASGI|nr:Anterior pharynx defective 1 [Fasciola gigantica]
MRFGFFKLITKADDGLRLIANNAQTSRLEMATRSVHSRDGGTYQRVPDVDSSQTVPVDQDDAVISSSPKDVSGRLLNHRIVSYVAGLGYGLMSGIVQLLHLLIAAYGPGIERIYWESKTFFIVASFEIMCVSLMHIFWSVVLFNAFDERKWMYLPLVYGTHLCVSAMSLLNQYSSPWPEIVCLAYTIVALLMALMSYVALRGRHLRSSAGTQPDQPGH